MQMELLEMANIFREHYRDKKIFDTPEIIRFGKKSHHIYELSKAHKPETKNDFKQPIFAVTVLTLTGKETEVSMPFKSREDAEAYIANDFYLERPQKRLRLWV